MLFPNLKLEAAASMQRHQAEVPQDTLSYSNKIAPRFVSNLPSSNICDVWTAFSYHAVQRLFNFGDVPYFSLVKVFKDITD